MPSRGEWDAEYRTGVWDYLRRSGEDARYAVIAGLIAGDSPEASQLVLDLGCGAGVLRERLRTGSVERYTGIDWSVEAVELARECGHPLSVFETASIDEWEPDGRYDAIVFNEVLYYLPRPLETVARYARCLTNEGSIIVSMWNPAIYISARRPASMKRIRVRLEYGRLWRQLARRWAVLADVVVKRDRLLTWRIQQLRPRVP